MTKKVNLNLTNNEKLARNTSGLESEATHINMQDEVTAESTVRKQNAEKFNAKVDEYVEKINKHSDLIQQYAQSIKDNMNSVEIKANGCRVLMKPFEANPFQRIEVSKSGFIIDTGGFAPEVKSSDTGEWEEADQKIAVGVIIDAGPDCKYLKEGDTVFYQKAAAIPVPFFRQGLHTVSETQVIAVVNEGLTERFNKVK